ncbi:MAG: 50S ribosomal protein L17 [Leptospirales bacterium]|jgi:large subunit ribosomal protein L17
MRKRNAVAQLNRTASHRKAMMRNMATSLFEHERIVTTRAKAKVLRSYSEKLITRAKANLDSDANPHTILHNKRTVMQSIRDRDIVKKLFEEIAPRYKERKGGYTRITHLAARKSDSAEMSVVELVDRVEKVRRVRAQAATAVSKDSGDKKPARSSGGPGGPGGPGGNQQEGKWYDRFRRGKKRDMHADS